MATNMKSSIFKISIISAIAVAALLLPATAAAQSKYERRIERREIFWQKLLPDMYMLQYAGGLATVSAGIGWDYGRSDQWETHILFGYIPHRYNHPHYFTFNIRQAYIPWKIGIAQSVRFKPLSVALSVNSILHGDFWMSEPDRYPHGYYGFSSRMRFHLAFGQRWTFTIPRDKRVMSSQLSVYYEISTCDLYVRQKVLNSTIPFKDILSLGFGVIFEI